MSNFINEIQKLDLKKILNRKEVVMVLFIFAVAFFAAKIIYERQSAKALILQKELIEQKEVGKLSSELERQENDLANLLQGTPTGKISTVNIVEKITELARNENISISAITPRSQLDKELYWEYPFEMDMEADYRQVKRFLSSIENAKEFFRVNYLTASPVAAVAGKDSKRLRVKMAISAISWKNDS